MKRTMKHIILLILLLCLAFLAYVLIGAIVPFTTQPQVSAATREAFPPTTTTAPARALTVHGWWTTTRRPWSSGFR